LDLRPDGVVRDGKSRGEFARQSASTGATFVTVVERMEETKAMADDFEFYVGIDLGAAKHQACVLNRAGRLIGELSFEHSGPGLTEFIRLLDKLTGNISVDRIAIAAETPRGLVVESVLERGFSVFSINPKQLDRFRDRHTVAGAKDDRRDAFVLADSLRTDQPLFRRLARECANIIRLRELSRLEDDLSQDHNRLINQLREQLHRYFPQLLQLSAAAEDPWLWDLIEIAPVPTAARKLTRGRIERLLKQHRVRRLTAEEVMTALRVPALNLAPGSTEAASEHALLLLPRLRLIRQQRLDTATRIENLLDELAATSSETDDIEPERPTDVAVLRSLPGVGRVVAATLLAEASQAITDRDYGALRSYAGVAPVTRQSGNKKTVMMRRGCNRRLRNAVYHWSRVATMSDERSRNHYGRLRARGHSHGRALRTLADRWLNTLVAMLRSHERFDPAKWNSCTATPQVNAL
jgi:transposase